MRAEMMEKFGIKRPVPTRGSSSNVNKDLKVKYASDFGLDPTGLGLGSARSGSGVFKRAGT